MNQEVPGRPWSQWHPRFRLLRFCDLGFGLGMRRIREPRFTARARESDLEPADLMEIVRHYGLRVWVEQSYKMVKGYLGWAEYQVRKDLAMRRHWQLVCCAFSFCWWALSGVEVGELELDAGCQPAVTAASASDSDTPRAGEKRPCLKRVVTWPEALRWVRAWLEPFLLLWRYWRAWSQAPPPRQLQRLLDWLFAGRPIYLYAR